MQPLLHGNTLPLFQRSSWVSESAIETTSPAALGSAVQERKAVDERGKAVAEFPARAAVTRRLIEGLTGTIVPVSVAKAIERELEVKRPSGVAD
jgi:hypothetical protein